MQRTIKALLPLILFSLITAFLLKGLQRHPNEVPSPYIGKSVPAFTATSFEHPDQEITQAVFKGQVTLLNVFASWCLSCRAEHPILMDIAQSKSVHVVGINYRDQTKDAKAMLSKFGNPYSMIIPDPRGKLAIHFGVYGTPESFIIDKAGIIRYRHVGPISPQNWKDTLYPLVKKLKKESA